MASPSVTEIKNQEVVENMYKVVYNSTYGGFDMSKKGLDEYNRRTSKNIKYADGIDRSDPTLIELVETMNKDINCPGTRLKIREFPIKYKAFLDWDEYDGKESVRIDYDRYLIYHIKRVKDNLSISSDEKLLGIHRLFNEYDARPKNTMDI
jgi:hypothetical protein